MEFAKPNMLAYKLADQMMPAGAGHWAVLTSLRQWCNYTGRRRLPSDRYFEDTCRTAKGS